MDKLQEFLILINTLTDKTIIFNNQGKALPSYPFITFQSTNKNINSFNILNRELTNDDLDVNEIISKNIIENIQIDFYDETFLGVRDLAKDFIDCIDFKYRREINSENFGIIEIGGLIDNTSLEQTKSMYRYTCDLTIDYTEEVERTVENLQSLIFANDEIETNIER